MQVRDVMTKDVITLRRTAPFKEVVETLIAAGVSGAPVVDDEGRLLGVVSEADLMTRKAYGGTTRHALALVAGYLTGDDPRWLRKSAGLTAEQLMTTAPVTVSPGHDMAVAARRMLDRNVNRLPVVDDAGRVVGIVARRDLLRPWGRSDDAIRNDVDVLLRDPRRVPEDNRVACEVVDGIVRLLGTVRVPTDAVVVEAAVRAVPGVVEMVSEITAEHPSPSLDALTIPLR